MNLSISATVFTGLIAWTLLLLVLMEVLRSRLVLIGAVPANGFQPDDRPWTRGRCRPARSRRYVDH